LTLKLLEPPDLSLTLNAELAQEFPFLASSRNLLLAMLRSLTSNCVLPALAALLNCGK
jgi:hypothetical protein